MERIKKITAQITDLDARAMEEAQKKLDSLTKPLGSLGRLEELAKQVCGITAKSNPSLEHKVIFTLAADHGVTDEGVSAYPKDVTGQMVDNFLKGGAGINVLARHCGARVVVVDMGVAVDLGPDPRLVIKKIAYGTKNMAKGPAMTRDEAIRAIVVGFEIFEDEFQRGLDIIGTGEMGIGNTSSASAITAAFTRKPVEEITGRGAGLDDKGLKNKIEVIKRSLAVNKPDPKDAIDVLSKVGGFEIAGLAGIILAAAAQKVPVVIDGFISGAAALIAYQIEPRVKKYLIAAHQSAEGGHKYILEHIGLRPLLDLDLRLGEGTGGALAMSLADAAIKILTQMATFESAKVSEKKK
ncbi:MAG: nicotinate-nucleotide--dimethylbenzimidazole phosphoribosyltransferase [Candidatus Omnitrophica bacterium]|nr:nicotinate-nucleotide--dimethylbenzimidazole phosphoribosyltransferase [Candidatus Omnitrophota bacterium]MDD5236747.1 nicotinate-nucleotide--dimethylbenzimidazole phosphoribosyltransferase [Candidatus Omnitrophota bacterium]MDD5610262.1 nicotinate-nucleotide--dimethylbenzimidazole phosphoribosyltransferase [Candidatus Omnitrophota bacterium]